MEFGLDLIGNFRGKSGDSHAAPLLDWPGLHARLAAAYDARRALLGQEISQGSDRSTAFGSFDRSAAARLSAASYASYLVNPTDLADGKVPSCIEANIAQPNIGDQGK